MWFWTLVPELPPTGFCCRQLIHRFTGTSPVVGFFDRELCNFDDVLYLLNLVL